VALETAGYRVLQAHDGAEGVRSALERVPDLILMDLSLPILDGWGAMARLKDDSRTASIPVLAVTAHVIVDGDYRRSREAGFAAYLTKPVEPRQVVEEVQRRLGMEEAAVVAAGGSVSD
jgi:two-component system, cell cycle response regulator DivK